jgi:hypothetical protein
VILGKALHLEWPTERNPQMRRILRHRLWTAVTDSVTLPSVR